MLKAELHFYKDARWAKGSRIGALLLLIREERSYVGFIPAKDFEEILSEVDEPVLQNILKDITPFLVRMAAVHSHDSEMDLAHGIAEELPNNIHMSEPATWPPDKIEELIVSAANEHHEILLYPV